MKMFWCNQWRSQKFFMERALLGNFQKFALVPLMFFRKFSKFLGENIKRDPYDFFRFFKNHLGSLVFWKKFWEILVFKLKTHRKWKFLMKKWRFLVKNHNWRPLEFWKNVGESIRGTIRKNFSFFSLWGGGRAPDPPL